MFISILILLGLIASVFLVFSNSLQFIRIGLVAALWAAAIAALAATRYRKEATIDKAKVRGLQTVYELQLEREVAARHEYELMVEARVRAEVGADAAEMAALRAELTVLRQNLQRLFDGDLPIDRPALRADATRIQELPRAMADPSNNSSANADGGAFTPVQQSRSSVTPVFDADHPEPPMFASPFDEPVTAETAIVTTDDTNDSAITAIDIDDDRYTEPRDAPRGWADAFTDNHSPQQPVSWPTVPRSAPAPEPTPPPRPTAPVEPGVGTTSSRRRRRAHDDTPSRQLSVAEIMANLRSEEGSV